MRQTKDSVNLKLDQRLFRVARFDMDNNHDKHFQEQIIIWHVQSNM